MVRGTYVTGGSKKIVSPRGRRVGQRPTEKDKDRATGGEEKESRGRRKRRRKEKQEGGAS